jgi:hypothetical protein
MQLAEIGRLRGLDKISAKSGFCPKWGGFGPPAEFVERSTKDQSEQFRSAIVLRVSDYDGRDAYLLSFQVL